MRLAKPMSVEHMHWKGFPQLHSGILLVIVASCKVSGDYIY